MITPTYVLKPFYLFSDQDTINAIQAYCPGYLAAKKSYGRNAQGELLIKGMLLRQYQVGGTTAQPIIFNLTTKTYLYDWREMGMNQQEAIAFHKDFNDTYNQELNSLFIFYGREYLEYPFTVYYPYSQGQDKMIDDIIKHLSYTPPKVIPELTYGDEWINGIY